MIMFSGPISRGLVFALVLSVLSGCLVAVPGRASAEAPSDPASRIAVLRAEIARHDDLYFRQAAPEISDAEYDDLKHELRALLARMPDAFSAEDAPDSLGDDRTGRFPTHAHRMPMLGLEKSHSEAELRKFLARIARAADDAVALVIEPKYDGLAISLTYEHGRLVRAVTRGNGMEGDVVTENLLRTADVPRELRAAPDGPAAPALIEIRGEVYMERQEFDRLNAQRIADGEPVHAHPRTLAVGTLKSLDSAAPAARRLALVGFGWGACEPAAAMPASQGEWLARLRAWGFDTPPAHVVQDAESVWGVIRALDRGRLEFPGPLDGVVVKVNDVPLRERLGSSRTAPLWAVAHKFEPARAETVLRAITWQVGRTGTLTPVAELDPVMIDGTTVARASLHNRREIERRDYRPGDTVRVEKAGDIIPQLVGVNLALRPAGSGPYVPPSDCPSCATALIREGEAALRCPQRSCPAQLRRRVGHFVSESGLNLRGFGPALASSLVDRGVVRDLDDLYRLTRDEVPAAVLEQIERSKRAEFWRLLAALGLPEIGPANARRLAAAFAGLEQLASADEEALRAAGLGAATARTLAAELQHEPVQRLLRSLQDAGVQPLTARESGRLAGKSFVFTGTLPNLSRGEAERRVREAGGRVHTQVGRGTSYVVAGEGGGRKLDDARRLNVPVLSEESFLALLADRE